MAIQHSYGNFDLDGLNAGPLPRCSGASCDIPSLYDPGIAQQLPSLAPSQTPVSFAFHFLRTRCSPAICLWSPSSKPFCSGCIKTLHFGPSAEFAPPPQSTSTVPIVAVNSFNQSSSLQSHWTASSAGWSSRVLLRPFRPSAISLNSWTPSPDSSSLFPFGPWVSSAQQPFATLCGSPSNLGSSGSAPPPSAVGTLRHDASVQHPTRPNRHGRL